MQLRNVGTVNNEIPPKALESRSEQTQTAAGKAGDDKNGGGMNLPEDVVSLSKFIASKQSASKPSNRSIPVSNAEIEALLKAYSGKVSFSTFA